MRETMIYFLEMLGYSCKYLIAGKNSAEKGGAEPVKSLPFEPAPLFVPSLYPVTKALVGTKAFVIRS